MKKRYLTVGAVLLARSRRKQLIFEIKYFFNTEDLEWQSFRTSVNLVPNYQAEHSQLRYSRIASSADRLSQRFFQHIFWGFIMYKKRKLKLFTILLAETKLP